MKVFFVDRPCRRRKPRLVPRLGVVTEQTGPVAPTPQFQGKKKGRLIVAFQLTDSQQTTVTIKPQDKKGNPAPVDGAPQWLVDNPNVLALTPSADGLSCLVAAVGPLGTATVSVKADADLGGGVTELVGLLEVEVTGGQAVTVALEPGTPTEQP